MIEYLPLILAALVTGSTIAVVALLLRIPLRLTEARARIAELEAAQAMTESNVKKALRRAGVARRKEASADARPITPPMGIVGADRPASSVDLEAVERAIALRRNQGGSA